MKKYIHYRVGLLIGLLSLNVLSACVNTREELGVCKPLIFGLKGTKLTPAEKELFQQNPVYGFILFKRNIANRKELIKLVNDLKSLSPKNNPKIFIDQEGGRVARLRPPIIKNIYPPAEFFREMYKKEGKHVAYDAVYENYSKLMQDLKDLNIDSPCAPVADLSFPGADKVIGDRSFGFDPNEVVALCISARNAIQDRGGIPIIKHIPGHGRAMVDSHLQLPHVDASIDELNNSDFAVFKQLSTDSKNQWAMVAHILFSALDSELPVTLSHKAINFIRNDIGFKGTLVSDAIEMGALHGKLGAQYQLVTKVLSVDDTGSEFVDKWVDKCIEAGVIKDKSELAGLLEQSAKIKSDFITSIVNVTKQSLAAGCDLVLHCNGDIDQMRQICGSVAERNFITKK